MSKLFASRRLRRPLLAALLGSIALWSCRKTNLPVEVPGQPSVRLYIVSTLAGAMEPCGCRKDMLGGIDHAAALLAADAANAPRRLVLGAGPLFFQEPELNAERREQDLWKAETLAASLAEVKLAAWAPGANDFAAGSDELARLTGQSGARLLGASVGAASAVHTAVFDVGGYKVGVAGVGAGADGAPPADAARVLGDAEQSLREAGAQIRVALIAAKRGDGLRLAEKVPGFALVALGKPTESGDANDGRFPPTLVGETLVVQAPNHLQAFAYVDLFVRSGDFSFQDGVGLELAEQRDSLKSRIAELESRRQRSAEQHAPAEQLAAVDRELERARVELGQLEKNAAAKPKPAGSVFEYDEAFVREGRGSDAAVAKRMSDYYKRVNDHNRVALAGRLPPPPPFGELGYSGGQACIFCHREADTFWRGTQHADAYATLSREFKEYNLDCVSCHVTGYERPGGSTVTHVERLKNVQCEACHGSGEGHAKSGGDTKLITKTPSERVCKGCHHTPHVADDWSAAVSWSKIVGPGHGEGAQFPAQK
ncbi:MAG TPA: multiheme c-type cytochrome [Polyangiaceae bacterium]|nr:multiheme c-type cytochrome [Polyangiaceae bacterium]